MDGVESPGRPPEPTPLSDAGLLVPDPSEVVRRLFRTHAVAGRGLQAHEFNCLSAQLASELGLDCRRFGDLSVAFHRFDVNGDGTLDEEECVRLAESMLRYYHEVVAPPETPGKRRMMGIETKNVEAHYVLSTKLGQGGQGAVYSATEIVTGHQRVVKFYSKGNTNAPLDEIKEEFRLLKSLDHPKIQRLYDIFEDRSNVYIVAEPYSGGDFTNLVENAMDARVHVGPSWLAKVFHQVLEGVAYLHSMYILHCDLKEGNIMIATDDSWREPAVKVIDFGLARNFVVDGSWGGTAGYIPPEVWTEGLWTPKGDVHALGVVIFQMFANGEKCFSGWSDDQIMNTTINDPPRLEAITSYWRRCQDLPPLISSMLAKEFRDRPSARQCMEHDFFQSRIVKEDSEDEGITPEFMATLSSITKKSTMQKAILADLASRVNLAELSEMNEAFSAMDMDGNGVITAEELRKALSKKMESPEQLEEAVARLVGDDGKVPYTSFMGLLLSGKASEENHLLWREFLQLDQEADGWLVRDEVARLLERPALESVLAGRGVQQLMDLMDTDGDERVSFEEFKRALSGEARPEARDVPQAKVHDSADQQQGIGSRSESDGASPDLGAGAAALAPVAGPDEHVRAEIMPGELRLHQQLEYNSPSLQEWIQCQVVAVNPNGAIQLDVKPGYWLKRHDQAKRLRSPL